jgi:hypothetical protein
VDLDWSLRRGGESDVGNGVMVSVRVDEIFLDVITGDANGSVLFWTSPTAFLSRFF